MDVVQFIRDFELTSILFIGLFLYFNHRSLQSLRLERKEQHEIQRIELQKQYEKLHEGQLECHDELVEVKMDLLELKTKYEADHERKR